jgi:hypothetical protein
MDDELQRYVESRDAALLSLNEGRIRALYREATGTELPSNPLVFWGSVHKAITGCKDLPIEFRRESKRWLDEQGLYSLDDGDL